VKYLLYVFAGICAVLALMMWVVFLRPAVNRTAQGKITEKIFKPVDQYVQYPTRTSASSFYAPSVISIAECYVFGIQIDGSSDSVGYSLNTLAASEFDVDQKVRIEYHERGFPGIWHRLYVTKMSRA
jgi:hypothetical protein